MKHTSCQRRCEDCPGQMVCHCLGITETVLIETLTLRNVQTVSELRELTGAGDGCTACHRRLAQYIAQYAQPSAELICSVR